MKTLLQKLVQTDSTLAQGELAAAEILKRFFDEAGIPCWIDCWDGNRANCIARLSGADSQPGLLFLSHLDVVPPGDAVWTWPPFSGLEQDGRICGRGATDMKGGLVAAAQAIKNLHDAGLPLKGDIVFAATAGEETDSCGVERWVQSTEDLPQFQGIVIPEPTDFSVINAHRGLLWLEITTHGKTAHGSTPQLGINAVTSMAKVLDRLNHYTLPPESHPQLGTGSLSVNTISGGKALNVIPDQCILGIDIRTLPSQSHEAIKADLQGMLQSLRDQDPSFSAEVSIIRSVGALETDPTNPFVERLCDIVSVPAPVAVGFTTDAPSVVPLGAPIVICGPGQGSACHQPNESIAWADVEKAVRLYEEIIHAYLT